MNFENQNYMQMLPKYVKLTSHSASAPIDSLHGTITFYTVIQVKRRRHMTKIGYKNSGSISHNSFKSTDHCYCIIEALLLITS